MTGLSPKCDIVQYSTVFNRIAVDGYRDVHGDWRCVRINRTRPWHNQVCADY